MLYYRPAISGSIQCIFIYSMRGLTNIFVYMSNQPVISRASELRKKMVNERTAAAKVRDLLLNNGIQTILGLLKQNARR